jgi:hypothetical protein
MTSGLGAFRWFLQDETSRLQRTGTST